MDSNKTEETSLSNAYEHEVGLAGEFGNFAGRAEVLEAFYCYQQNDVSTDFGFGNSVKSLPTFPTELGMYKDKTFHVTCKMNYLKHSCTFLGK
jgi:hypothetical protein